MFVSIIVPTYNEAKNLPEFIKTIDTVMQKAKLPYECVVVDDDSPDGTYQIATDLSNKFNVRAFLRKERGLSSAMLFGLQQAHGQIIGCIDADFQHNPEIIPELVRAIEKEEYLMSIGSRLVPGGGIRDWSLHRRLVSWGARAMVRPLTFVKDTMSGFFFIKPEVIQNVQLKTIGYKLCLEIIVKGKHNRRIKEVPYVFTHRKLGSSKMNFSTHLQYLRHIILLYLYKLTN